MPKKITATKKVTKEKNVKKPVAKKVSKKAPAKKSSVNKKNQNTKATKKTPTKKGVSSKTFIYADNDKSFWVTDGQILNSLLALHEALLEMEDGIFEYHVNSEKNDFAEWVDYVLCDGDCAKDLRKIDSRKKASSVVAKHLKSYKN